MHDYIIFCGSEVSSSVMEEEETCLVMDWGGRGSSRACNNCTVGGTNDSGYFTFTGGGTGDGATP